MIEEQVNKHLAGQVGFDIEQVEFLRREFRKCGRNPLDSSLEILALENGLDEKKSQGPFRTASGPAAPQ